MPCLSRINTCTLVAGWYGASRLFRTRTIWAGRRVDRHQLVDSTKSPVGLSTTCHGLAGRAHSTRCLPRSRVCLLGLQPSAADQVEGQGVWVV